MISSEIREWVHINRNHLKRCPVCNHAIEDRVISIYQSLIVALWKVYCWCQEKNVNEFNMKDIRHLLGQINYNRFNDLVRFGGLVYRPKDKNDRIKRGFYGLNLERVASFYRGEYAIPAQIVVDQITGKTLAATYVSVKNIPELMELLETDEGKNYLERKVLDLETNKEVQDQRGLPTVDEYLGR